MCSVRSWRILAGRTAGIGRGVASSTGYPSPAQPPTRQAVVVITVDACERRSTAVGPRIACITSLPWTFAVRERPPVVGQLRSTAGRSIAVEAQHGRHSWMQIRRRRRDKRAPVI
jgi:hypothetical protein